MSDEIAQCNEPAGAAGERRIRLLSLRVGAWEIQSQRNVSFAERLDGLWRLRGDWVTSLMRVDSGDGALEKAEAGELAPQHLDLKSEPQGVWRWDAERVQCLAFTPQGSLDGAYLLLADGRLCISKQRGVRRPSLELLDWTSGGPFLLAEPNVNGWDVFPTLAGVQLPDWESIAHLWCVLIANADQSVGET